MNNVSGSVNVRHSRPTMPLMIAIVIVLVIIAFTVILLFSLPSSIWLEISEHYPYNTSNPFDLNNTLLIFLFPKSINLNGGYNSLYVIIAFQENNKIYAIYYYYYPYYPYSSSEDITKCNDTQSIIVGYVSTCNANFNAFPQMLITETYTFSYPQGLLPSILLPYYILNGIYTTEPNESFINITTFLRTLIRDIKDGKITQLDVYLTDGNVFWLLLSNKIEYLNSSNFYLLAPGLVVYNYTQLQLNIQGTIMKPQWIQITEEHNVFGPYYTVNFEWFIVRNVSLNAFITNNSNDDWLFSSMNIISIYSYSYFQMVMIFIIPFILITYTIIRELHDFYDTTIKKPAMNTEETIGKAIKENIYIIILTTSFIFSTQSVALQNYPHLDNFTLYMLFAFLMMSMVIILLTTSALFKGKYGKVINALIFTVSIIILISLILYSYYIWSKLAGLFDILGVNSILFPPPLTASPSLEFYVQTPLITIYIKPFLAIPINVALAFLVLFPYIFIIILFALLIGIYYVDIRRITASFKNLIRKGTH